MSKPKNNKQEIDEISVLNTVSQDEIQQSDTARIDTRRTKEEMELLSKIEQNSVALETIADSAIGVQAYNRSKHTEEQIENRVFHSDKQESEDHLPQISGKDVSRYSIEFDGETWIQYGEHLHDCRDIRYLSGPRILVRQIPAKGRHKIQAGYAEETYCNYNTVLNVLSDDEESPIRYILAVLNSSLMSWVFPRKANSVVTDSFPKLSVVDLERIPIQRITGDADDGNLQELRENQDSLLHSSGFQPGTKSKPVLRDYLPFLTSTVENAKKQRKNLNLQLGDHLGTYADGPTLAAVGFTQPAEGVAESMLHETTETRSKLGITEVSVEREGPNALTVSVAVRYKPDDPGAYETDANGYRYVDSIEALRVTDLTEREADLVESFVPVAVADELGGFRKTAAKTISPMDRLEALTLPAVEDVAGGLAQYRETEERAAELDAKIERTDDLIDEIVYELYGLTDEEIEIVEEAVGD